MALHSYFKDNYTTILEWASNIYRNTEIEPSDVVAELYLDLTKRKFDEIPTDEQKKFYILRWLKSRKHWTGGNVIKKYKIQDTNPTIFKDEIIEHKEVIEQDLSNAGFNDYQIDKITNCIRLADKMPLYYKKVFYSYYIDGLTMEEIGKSCGLPKSAIFSELAKIKKYIKEELNKTTLCL